MSKPTSSSRRLQSAQRVLQQFRAADSAFVLVPPPGHPIAIYTQQSRALNLIWALHSNGVLQGKRVIVIGGGVAGATAAAGAATCGASVVLVESEFELFTKQLGCHHRFLHPRIHEWPSDKSLMASANLPLLNWTLDTAHSVAERMLEGFNAVLRQTSAIDVRLDTTAEAFDATTKTLTIRSASSADSEALQGDVFIFAAGFGFDGRAPGVMARPYWRADSLDQPPVRPATKRAVLIVGDGDGAAIDVLRARLRSFDHGPFVDRFLSRIHDTALRDAVKNAEAAARRSPRGQYAKTLDKKYIELADEKPLRHVWEGMREQLRDDVRVLWLAQPPRPLSDKSFSFNRLLSWLLLYHGEVEFRSGTLASAEFRAAASGNGGAYHVQYVPAGSSKPEPFPDAVDELLVRYRDKDVANPLEVFSGLSRSTSDPDASPRLLPEAFDLFADWSYQQTPPSLEARVVTQLGPAKISKKDWYGYRVELKVVGVTAARRAHYVLHPEQGEIIRRAAAVESFSTSIFTWDDYWVEAHLSDGTYVAGRWLSNLISDPKIRRCLREQAELLGGDYDRSSRPKANSRSLDRFIRRELTRAAHE